jgi:hypothetical protein
MAKEWSEADDSVGTIASGLIPNYHPHLASARILYIFVSEASKKGGQDVFGKVKRVSSFLEWVMEKDFILEIALPKWNELPAEGRTALVDHLLERCTGEENEDGSLKWGLREPEVQEFASILDRYGAWHQGLAGFVSVAKRVNLEGFVEDDTATDLNAEESSEETVSAVESGGDPEDDLEV